MIVFLLPLAFGLVQDHGAADQGKDGSKLLSALLPLLSAPTDGFQATRLPSLVQPGTSASVMRAPPMMAAEQKPLKVSSEEYELQGAEASPLELLDGSERPAALAKFAKAAPMALAANAAVAAPAVAAAPSAADKLLSDFLPLFPVIFTGGLVAFVVANTALKQIDLGDRDDQMAQVMQFVPIAAAGAIGVLIYTQPGLILFPLKTASGVVMKATFDVWNLVAPSIGLGGAILKY
jgi:hypothetical protein